MTSPPRLVFLLGLLVLLVLLGVVLHPVGTGQDRIVDDRDAYLHTWNPWWVKTALADLGSSPYSTTYNGYPDGVPLTFHQLLLPLGVFSIPLFFLGLDAGQVLLGWQYLLAVVGFAGMYRLVRAYRRETLGAVVAGLYFVLVPIYWQNLARPDSLAYVLLPWMVLSVRWSNTGSRWRVLVPSGLGGVVLLMSPYLGAGLGLLWLCALPFRKRLDLNFGRVLSLVPLMYLFTSFHWLPQVVTNHPNLPDRTVLEHFSADLTAWVLPSPRLWWVPGEWAWWTDLWKGREPGLYVGLVALIVIVLGLLRHRSSRIRWSVGVCLVFFLGALGPGITVLGETYFSGYLPYAWGTGLVPSLSAFRAPLRLGFFVFFFLSLALGVFFPGKGRVGWLVAILLLAELMVTPVRTVELPSSSVLRQVGETVEEPALVPVPLTDWPTEVQYAQTIHEKKMPLIGISYVPDGVWTTVNANPVLEALYEREPLPETGWESLKDQGYGGVIVHWRLFPDHLEDRREAWLLTLRDRFGEPTLTSDRITLFTFDPE